jgi:hypothetical protein
MKEPLSRNRKSTNADLRRMKDGGMLTVDVAVRKQKAVGLTGFRVHFHFAYHLLIDFYSDKHLMAATLGLVTIQGSAEIVVVNEMETIIMEFKNMVTTFDTTLVIDDEVMEYVMFHFADK